MKLIIDIDERAYKGCMELKSNDDMGLLGLHLINATANGIPLEEELEKIKGEIQELAYYDNNYCGFVLPEWKISDIIYDYIRELKGDSDENNTYK